MVTIDPSASTNVTLLAAAEERQKSRNNDTTNNSPTLKRIVSPGVTQVVGVPSPSDDAEPNSISYAAAVVSIELPQGHLGGVSESRTDTHHILVEADKQSADVEAFLARSRVP